MGKKPEKLTGLIEFKNVEFKYPSRPDVQVLNKLNLTINPGLTVALVVRAFSRNLTKY